ncbi:hypothetical protein AUEXF2481DRAFT_62688 [Aureobasidium subglaciale EXF-2481]|uniref:Urea active transporter n=1 Tax=Aureobasidium subglaciale (strain EXF-2481) TaxID=1043005 RepID=A0A074YQY7_AURSE|nr:uncharacterized protein AUEXF2481DRAFT_62688 [Aureobasidium subglaciale EXF-2481]KAI5198836.1 Na+/solute symporter [Aureobasidium subglaciale]KAI5217640.1 Na+/solute symporter [Aureobasidium subglaciale]KAI5221218.1 Na+/solute symporter [Aureobasidium subglaciale]KAI5258946.1 Na+/solute symporter [Aureobasidium subglaciale]KEQ98579.1 hypothetical protein AUEXF2481DRAFT_62688 [Aureobasidium subglaciale EXF-2481]
MAGIAVLSQGAGYGVVLGVGFLFALGMMFTTYVLRRYNNELQTSEVFSTAGRSVKSGLVAAAVVSSWTWAATLLQSSAVAYNYGVSGPFWYASGATVQVILFATLAIELKRRAPNAHTFLEAIRARYGGITHGVFITFGLMTNVLVTAMLLTGGSAVIQDLTGMNPVAACFLLPVGVVLYTMFGGIKATFITDWVHTVVILVIIFLFAFTTYATNNILGSPSAVYDALKAASARHPVDGNAEGSYLTMQSREGGIFFVINLVGNFGTVYLDNGYWNKAIAASPVHALPGYIMGGLSWFAIPWLCATTMGLAALALENNPVFPTYPLRMAAEDVTAGLVLPNAAVALLGKGGAAATLVLIFMAVTSAMSAELIAVSSIWTYDIYNTYINPKAQGKNLIYMSHVSCVVYALIMAAFSTGLYYAGIGMGYLYLLMGVIIGGGVLPASLTLLWDRQSWAAATFSPIIALACALIGWLVQAKTQYGDLSVTSTGSNYPMLVGNVVALLTPVVVVPIFSLVFKTEKYDWLSMKQIRRSDDSELTNAANVDPELLPGGAEGETAQSLAAEELEQKHLLRASKIARTLTVCLVLCFLILWPMPMYGTGYVFSKKFFTGWIVVGILWLFVTSFCVGIYPVIEGRKTIARTLKSMYLDVTGKKHPVTHGRATVAETAVVEEKRGEKKERDAESAAARDSD